MIIVLQAPSFSGGNEYNLAKFVQNKLEKTVKNESICILPAQNDTKNRNTGMFYDLDVWFDHQGRLVNECINIIKTNPNEKFSFFAVDWWCPGIEQIWLYAKFNNISAKFYGWLHGASWVKGDLMGSRNILSVTQCMENSWKNIYDKTFYTSNFFIEKSNTPKEKLQLLREPFSPEFWTNFYHQDKKYDVVLVGRPSEDRAFAKSIKILENSGLSYYVMSPSPLSEEQVYNIKRGSYCDNYLTDEEQKNIFVQSKAVFSLAKQEGWGYGVMKAVSCGCVPVLINSAVYPELYKKEWLFPETENDLLIQLELSNRVNTITAQDNENAAIWASTNLNFDDDIIF